MTINQCNRRGDFSDPAPGVKKARRLCLPRSLAIGVAWLGAGGVLRLAEPRNDVRDIVPVIAAREPAPHYPRF